MDTKGATMFPPTEAHSNLAEIHARDPKSGEMRVREHFYAHQLKQDTPEKQDKFFQAGGAGLFAKPKEYVKLLAAILNEGTSPTTGKQILKPQSVELFWENQIRARQRIPRVLPPAGQPAARLDVRGVPDHRGRADGARQEHHLVDGLGQLLLVGGSREGGCRVPGGPGAAEWRSQGDSRVVYV